MRVREYISPFQLEWPSIQTTPNQKKSVIEMADTAMYQAKKKIKELCLCCALAEGRGEAGEGL